MLDITKPENLELLFVVNGIITEGWLYTILQ